MGKMDYTDVKQINIDLQVEGLAHMFCICAFFILNQKW